MKRWKWFAMMLWGSVLVCAGQSAAGRGVGSGEMVVTLVGTGGPELTPERSGIATLVEASGERLLFDAGRGTLEGLYRARVGPETVTKVFLTHLHSDHISGLPDLWMTPWFLLGRTERMEVWGPVGTQAMVDGMRAMYGHDVEHRANAVFKRSALEVTVHEIRAGEVFREGGVVVTAASVEHADGDPAMAYRVEAEGRAVLLTGDCTLTAGLVEAGKGSDLVVANVAAGTAEMEAMAKWKPVFAKLLTPEQAAEMFKKVGPRLAVFSHVVKKGLAGKAGDDVILARTRAAGYAGALRMGADGMRIAIGKTVVVTRSEGKLGDLDGTGVR